MAGVAGTEETGTQRIHKMGQVVMGLGIMGQIQVTPRWVNDPVWLHNRCRRESGQGQVWAPPPQGNQAEVGEVRSGLIIVELLT